MVKQSISPVFFFTTEKLSPLNKENVSMAKRGPRSCDFGAISSWHTGVFTLKIISNNADLLVILISTTFAALGSSRMSNEAKNYRELEFWGLSCCFSVVIE